ncbi:MAG: acyltransferase [Actinobacteria bacterium]|nr:acyltransferase [Actinomycetota bacterium]
MIKIERYEDKIQKELFARDKSKIAKYINLFVGKKGFLNLLKYEIITVLFQDMRGALGIFFRNLFYPLLFKKVGKGVSFGKSVTIRHPHKISIEDDVVIDDYCVLDAKGLNNNGIYISKNVFVGRGSILSCKNGDIILEKNVNIGFNSEIFSGSKVVVGENTLIAAYVYIIGGGHDYSRVDIPISEQEKPSHGIKIEKNCWIGAGAEVFDNVTIGEDTIIGAGAVVSKDIPAFSIAAGVPARVAKSRK